MCLFEIPARNLCPEQTGYTGNIFVRYLQDHKPKWAERVCIYITINCPVEEASLNKQIYQLPGHTNEP